MIIKKSLLCVIGFLMLVLLVGFQTEVDTYAAPANPSPQELHQADGTVITGYTRGDEFFSWHEDEYENIIAYDTQDKNWCYAYVQDDMLLPGSEVVGTTDEPGLRNIRIKREDIGEVISNNVETSSLNISTSNKFSNESSNEIGLYYNNIDKYKATEYPKTNQELLLVTIDFNDIELKKDGEYWHKQYFEDDKSVANYYKDMSGGLEIFKEASTPNINNPNKVTVNVNYNGENKAVADTPWVKNGVGVTISSDCKGVINVKFDMPHPILTYDMPGVDYNIELERILITMAMRAINVNTNYDFSDVGINKQIAVIVAGRECSVSPGSGSSPGEVWAHSFYFNLYDDDLSIDDTYARKIPYAMHGEMHNEQNTVAIGVSCHELGHVLGLPDLYNTKTKMGGLGCYSLMAMGYLGLSKKDGETIPGSTPVALDAWSKYMLGYTIPVEYDAKIYDKDIVINSAGSIGNANNKYNVLRLSNKALSDKDFFNEGADNKASEKQYFLIENRQNQGWDAGMQSGNYNLGENFTGGILILQIDENIPFEQINNCDRHRGVGIVGAPDNGGVLGNYFIVHKYNNDNRKYGMVDENDYEGKKINPTSSFYTIYGVGFENSDLEFESREVPSNITVYVTSGSSDTMTVEVGEDTIINLKDEEEKKSEFPDENFLAEVRKVINKTDAEDIRKSDLLGIKTLDISDKLIYNLDGIEYFRHLEELYCYFNEFESIDVSGNPDLKILDCSYSINMPYLDVTQNRRLEELYCNYSSMKSLDVSRNLNLIALTCYGCKIEELDVSHNLQLELLECWKNRLTSIDVTNNTNLQYFNCCYNNITSIDNVVGWQGKGLVLGETFVYDPQRVEQTQ